MYHLDANAQSDYEAPQGQEYAHSPLQRWFHWLRDHDVRTLSHVPEYIDTDSIPCASCVLASAEVYCVLLEMCPNQSCHTESHECLGIQEGLVILLRMGYSMSLLKKWIRQVCFRQRCTPGDESYIVREDRVKDLFLSVSAFDLFLLQEDALWERTNQKWNQLSESQIPIIQDSCSDYIRYASGNEGIYFDCTVDRGQMHFAEDMNTKEIAVRRALGAPIVTLQQIQLGRSRSVEVGDHLGWIEMFENFSRHNAFVRVLTQEDYDEWHRQKRQRTEEPTWLDIPMSQIFTGRNGKTAPKTASIKPSERLLTPDEMIEAIHEGDLPEACEFVEIGGPNNDSRIKFRFRSSVLSQNGQLLRYDSYQVRVFSPIEGNCFFKCLAHICRDVDDDWQAYEEAFAAAQLAGSISAGHRGHDLNVIKHVCKDLKIHCDNLVNIQATMYSWNKSDMIRHKVIAGDIPFLPAIALDGRHCVLLVDMNAKKNTRTYRLLEAAFIEAKKFTDSPVQIIPVNNSQEFQSKRVKKQLAKDKAIGLKEEREKRMRKKIQETPPEVLFMNCVHFHVRTTVKNAAFDLPEEHETDALMALYCEKIRTRTQSNPIPPPPKSQQAVLSLASLQKGKHARFFEKTGMKSIQTYRLKPEFVTQTVEVRQIAPLPALDTVYGARRADSPVPESLKAKFGFEHDSLDERTIEDMVKMVDSRAVNELTYQTVVSIISGPNYRAGTIDVKDMNDRPFEFARAAFNRVTGLFQTSTLKVNPQGKLCALLMMIINAYGLDVHESKAKKSSHTSGGHTGYRTLINCMIARNLSTFAQMAYNSNRKQPLIMYNVGAKFLSDKNIINKTMEVDYTSIYPITDRMSNDERKHSMEMRDAWRSNVEQVKSMNGYNLMTPRTKLEHFCNLHLRAGGDTVAINALLDIQRVTIVHVRPCEDKYDAAYWAQNWKSYRLDTWQPGHPDHVLVKRRIQDVDDEKPGADVVYYMNDVHYYLSSWTPRNVADKDVFFCSGINFFPCPGRYQLGFNEGDYHIDGDGQVRMKTRGTSLMYSHPLVTLVNPEQTIYLGWTSIVRSFGLARHFKVYRHAATGFHTDHSIQTNYLFKSYEGTKELKSVDEALKNAFPAWTADDYKIFLECLRRMAQKSPISSNRRIEIMSYLHPTNIRVTKATRKNRNIIYGFRWIEPAITGFVGPKVGKSTKEYIHPLESHLQCSREEVIEKLHDRERDFLNDRGIFNYLQYLKPVQPNVEHVNFPALRKQILADNDEYIKETVEDSVPDYYRTPMNYGINTMLIYCGRKKKQAPQKTEQEPQTESQKLVANVARMYPMFDSVQRPPLMGCPGRGTEMLRDLMKGWTSEDFMKVLEAYKKEVKKHKPPKIKIQRNVDPRFTVQASDYYHVKDFEDDDLLRFNPWVISDGDRFEGQMGSAIRWAREDSEIMAIYKNKKVPFEGLNRSKKATISGSEVRNSSTGSKVICFEYSSKAVLNVMRALQRHLSAKQYASDVHIQRFRGMVIECFQDLVGAMLADGEMPNHYLFDYPAGQDQWSDEKKGKYEENLLRTFYDPSKSDYLGSFTAMVKSGEVYTTDCDFLEVVDGKIQKQKSRPRLIMVPSWNGCGIMQAIQTYVFPMIRKHIPGFIHAMNGRQTVQYVRQFIGVLWKAISLDGSAFDSSQFKALMEVVDDTFWKMIRPYLREVIEYNWHSFRLPPTVAVDDIVDNLMKSLLQNRNHVFVHAPGVDSPAWPDEIKKRFYRDIKESAGWPERDPERDWFYLELEGTTFSGHSTKTTLGNTLRTLCYAWYYQQCAGIDTPWRSRQVFTIASGDDCVIFVEPRLADHLMSKILQLTTRNTKAQQVGLGQCVKEISIGPFWDIEFCSKWSFTIDGTLEGWRMCRDVTKIITQKQMFTGQNMHILGNPVLHRLAILIGFRSEKLSHVIEDMLQIQLGKFGTHGLSDMELKQVIGQMSMIRYAQDPADYELEPFINDRLGKSIYDVLRLLQDDVLYSGRSPRCRQGIQMQKQQNKSSAGEQRQDRRRQRTHPLHAKRTGGQALKQAKQILHEAKVETEKNMVQRPYYTKGNLVQAKNSKEVMSAWDMQLVAKQHPGQLNSPYVAGMNITNLPTSEFSVSRSFSDSNVYGVSDIKPLGTTPYTLLMWCSSTTAFGGDGKSGNISASDRLGGLVIKQVNSADMDTPWLSRQVFQETLSAYTALETYGSDMSGFSAGGFIWASEAKFNILCAQANIVGAYYKGTMQFGQLPQDAVNGLSLNQIIGISGDVEVLKPTFHMRTGVVNHEILYDSQQNTGEYVHDAQFVGELVNFVVLQNVAQNITTGQDAEFELQMNVKGNTVFWAKPQDTIANNLFKVNKEQRSPMPAMLAGVQQDPQAPSRNISSFGDGMRRMLHSAWDNRGALLSIASRVAPMVLAENTIAVDAEPNVIKANYLDSLEHVLSGLRDLAAQNPTFDVQLFRQHILDERNRVRAFPGRIIPIPQTPQDRISQLSSALKSR